METTTIVGIVMAVLIMVIGLYLLLRDDKQDPALNQALNLNADSQLPIIPRHLRARLATKKHPVMDETENLHNAQLDLDLNSTSLSAEPSAVIDVLTTPEHHVSDVNAVEHPESTHSMASQDTQLQLSPKSAGNPKNQDDVEESLNLENNGNISGRDFSYNADLETAQVSAFSGESNLLDAHLSEQQRRDAEADITNADHVITLKVMANPRRALSGDKALKVMLKYGLRYGELSCFHRHEEPDQDSALMFSVLRITDFGYAGFDLENLGTEQVQGMAFFMTFPHSKALTGFDMMSSIAHLIANEIDGRMFDETHREFTPQLKMHWRNHVIDYMAKKPS